MSDSDDDFMSDKFLQVTEPPKDNGPITYAERRRKALAKSFDKGRVLSRKEKEHMAREEGLQRNLITETRMEDDARGPGQSNKALAMMQKMGFKPGQALGKQDNTKAASEDGQPAKPKARVVPLDLHFREGRGGIGTDAPKAKRRRLDPGAPLDQDEQAHKDAYVLRHRSEFDERKAEGILRGARRTLEELDRREGIEASVMWLEPKEHEQEIRRKAHALRMGERLGSDDEDYEDLKKLIGKDAPVQDEDAPPTDKEVWLSLDARSRLAETLLRLRDVHHYCLWCGCQYNDAEDLEENCPGEREDDH